MISLHYCAAGAACTPPAAHPPPPPPAAAASLPQPEDHPQQPHQPGQEAGSCFARYPWIRGALDSFYEPAWAAANASTQTTEESLEALRRIMWPKQ